MTDLDRDPDDVEPKGGVALGAWLQDRQARNQAAVNERHARRMAETARPTKVAEPGDHKRGQTTNDDLEAIHQHRVDRNAALKLQGEAAFARAIAAAPGLMAEMQKLTDRNRS